MSELLARAAPPHGAAPLRVLPRRCASLSSDGDMLPLRRCCRKWTKAQPRAPAVPLGISACPSDYSLHPARSLHRDADLHANRRLLFLSTASEQTTRGSALLMLLRARLVLVGEQDAALLLREHREW